MGRAPGPAVPTVAEYVEVVAAGYGASTAASYRTHWRLLVARLGDRPIDGVSFDDCSRVVDAAAARARAAGAEGRSSKETWIGALRAVFERARL